MQGGRYVAAVIIAVAPSIPQLTGACSVPLQFGYWQRAPVAGDTNAPTNVVFDVTVNHDDGFQGCGNACWNRSYLVLEPHTTDAHTPPERIGYRFKVVAGDVPPSLDLPDEDETLTTYGGFTDRVDYIAFPFDYNAPSFSFDLEVVAVDESGNESEPIVLDIDSHFPSRWSAVPWLTTGRR